MKDIWHLWKKISIQVIKSGKEENIIYLLTHESNKMPLHS